MIRQKRAVSAVVATVLLVLITIAAVAIIWGAVRPMLSSSANAIQSACTTAALSVSSVCKNVDNSVKVNVERKADVFDMAGTQVTVKSAVGSVSKTDTSVIGINGMKQITTDASANAPISVTVAPIITVGTSTQICGITDALPVTANCA